MIIFYEKDKERKPEVVEVKAAQIVMTHISQAEVCVKVYDGLPWELSKCKMVKE